MTYEGSTKIIRLAYLDRSARNLIHFDIEALKALNSFLRNDFCPDFISFQNDGNYPGVRALCSKNKIDIYQLHDVEEFVTLVRDTSFEKAAYLSSVDELKSLENCQSRLSVGNNVVSLVERY